MSQASQNNNAYTDPDSAPLPAFSPPKRTGYFDPNASFNLGSGGASFANMQPGSFRQFHDQNGNLPSSLAQIYSVSYLPLCATN